MERCTKFRASQMARMVKNLPANEGDENDPGSVPGSGRPPWREKRHPTPVVFLEDSRGKGAWQTAQRAGHD